PAPGGVDGLDRLALVVRLPVLEGQPETGGRPLGGRHVVGQRGPAVDLGLPLAEQVEVRAVEQQHERAPGARRGGAHGDPASAASASAATVGSTPVTTSTPSGPSRAKVSPSTAFLSRAISVISSSGSTPGGGAVGRP